MYLRTLVSLFSATIELKIKKSSSDIELPVAQIFYQFMLCLWSGGIGLLVVIKQVRYAEVSVVLRRLLCATGHNDEVFRTPDDKERKQVARLSLLMLYDIIVGMAGALTRLVLAVKGTDYFSHEPWGATALAHRDSFHPLLAPPYSLPVTPRSVNFHA